ncbi:hypothetical protein GIB67_010788 [Kingdonia uniflora]|uniref:Mitochondrial outer membrane protein porin 2-like n=1 Tax=Kingdonia uniflora TaxID=39325 RepID=A0A7J7L903_9MAGN|nr:hypothetical protein GIB67_010788 [Kingdonia uniflora]
MSKGPGFFSDIGKKAKDLLTKDYSYDQKFTIATYSNAGVALTSTALKKGGLSTGDIGLQYKYNNNIIDVKVDTESNVSTTFTITEILPSTKVIASFKVPDYKSSKLDVQYSHDHATFTTTVALNQSPAVDITATLGTPSFAIGAEAGYETTLGTFVKYNAGVSVKNLDYDASIILADKGDSLRASYVHHLDNLKLNSCVAEISRRFSTNENTFTVGGSYALDPLTSVKARLSNHGKLGALLQHQLQPKSVLTLSSEFDTKALDKNPRFGLALALKP